jgi:fatty-acyl-CoA synthase
MTSGTTGAPKAAPLHTDMIAAAARNTIDTFQLGPDSHFLDYIPPFTVGGLFLTGLPMLLAGGTSLVRNFSPFAFADLVTERQPTHAILLPTMVAVLRHTSSWAQMDLSSFEAIGSGASTVPESVGNELLARGAQRFLHLYGSTECLTPVLFQRTTAQTPGPHTVFSTLCGDYQAQLAEDGELLLRGSAVMRGYLGEPARDAQAFDDGWFKTGDLFAHANGVWQFTGRKKEILKIGGFSVSPALIEKVILDAPGVRNCVVVKETLRSGGEALVAVIEGAGVERRTVLAHCAAHLPPDQTPRRIVVVAALPLNAMRKVDRHAAAGMVGP